MIDYNAAEFSHMNQQNYKQRRAALDPDWGKEVNEEPSQTVPGESFTVKEIMDRILGGIKPEFEEVQFFDQENLDRINDFPIDLTDLDRTRTELEEMTIAVDAAIAESESQPEEEPEVPEEPEEPEEDAS